MDSGKKENKVLKIVRKRGIIQPFATLLTNIHLTNFLKAKLYTGNGKGVCVPGLNCYSCPGATAACPIGSFQAVAGSSKFKFSYYISGILIMLGVIMGRLVCGFLCPFGWFQDLLNKIPIGKLSTKKVWFLRYIKYFILVVTVCLLPALAVHGGGVGEPYFCKYVCPQGILEGGIPLSIGDRFIAAAIGTLFEWKLAILISIIVLSVVIYRPFCKWICPLGAIYSLFNKISFIKYNVNADKCISCGKCASICGMDVDIVKNPNGLECIRCGECLKKCPTNAISIMWGNKKGNNRDE